jgi:hypothetical protein
MQHSAKLHWHSYLLDLFPMRVFIWERLYTHMAMHRQTWISPAQEALTELRACLHCAQATSWSCMCEISLYVKSSLCDTLVGGGEQGSSPDAT